MPYDNRNIMKSMCAHCQKEDDPEKLFAKEMFRLGFRMTHGICCSHTRKEFEKRGINFDETEYDY